jgi:hypothetical protein
VNCVRIHELILNRRPDEAAEVSRTVRTLRLAERPGAAARTFRELMDTVLYYVLGWDVRARRPLRKVYAAQPDSELGGLLGVTRAWSVAVETQGRGSLHMHMLVWTAGHGNFLRRLASCPTFAEVATPPPAPVAAINEQQQQPSTPTPTAATACNCPPSNPSPIAGATDHLDHKHSQPQSASPTAANPSAVASSQTATTTTDAKTPQPAAEPQPETKRKCTLAVEFERLIDHTITAELAIEQRALALAQHCQSKACGGKLKFDRKQAPQLRYALLPSPSHMYY